MQAELVRSVSGTARGKAASPAQRAAILHLLTQLEAVNPTPNPANSPLINGMWALLYQGQDAVLAVQMHWFAWTQRRRAFRA